VDTHVVSSGLAGDSIARQITGEEFGAAAAHEEIDIDGILRGHRRAPDVAASLKAGLGRALRLRRHKPGLCRICFV
jgi:hypothetical protein